MSSNLVAMFPVEIFEEIIDQSSYRDGSLCRLSLTCHAFLPRARLNLFFHIHIGHKEKLEFAPTFLQARPWLPPLVHSVTIRDYAMRYAFMLHAVIPSRLITMLPSLRSIEYALDWRGIGPWPDTVRSYLVHSRLQQSILHKSCTSIRHLALSLVVFRTTVDFVRLLCALPNLKSLICRATQIYRREDDTSLVKSKTLHLTHFDTDGTFDPAVLELLLTMGQDTLENLSMTARPLSGIGWSRREDGISWVHSAKQHPMFALFSRLRHLQTLTLSLHDVYIQNAGFITLEFATEILNNMPVAGALQCLHVVWSPGILASLALNPSDVPHHLFKTFEESITRLPLRQVVFSPPHYRTNRRGLWRSVLDRVFPSLKERGILQVTDRPPHRNRRTAWLSETSAGHHDHVSSLVVSPNGRVFTSSSYDSTIILWNVHQGTIEYEWVGHGGHWVNSLAFSPDSRYLLSGGDDGTLQVWDTLGGQVKQVQVLGAAGGTEEGPDLVRHIVCGWSPDGMWIASRSGTGTVHLWDGRSFHRRRVFEEPATASCLPSFSPDSGWLVWLSKLSDDSAEYFCVWDALAPDAPPRRLPAHSDDPLSTHILPFDPTSKRLVTTHGAHLRVWDVITGAQLAVMGGHSGYIATASFSPDGRHILSASHDGTAKVWDTKSGECTLSLEGHRDRVDHAHFSPDGNYIATASDDTTVRLWRSGDGSCLATFTEREKLLTYIVFSPDGKRLASGDSGGIVHIRDISHIIGQ